MTSRKKDSDLRRVDSGIGMSPMIPFKEKKSFAERKAEANLIKEKFPCKIPVVVEKYQKERYLPILDKAKFLVPEELSVSQLQAIIRSRLHLDSTQAFYLIVGRKTLPCMSLSIAEIYTNHQDQDGFLYLTYASQEIFGGSASTVGECTRVWWASVGGESSSPVSPCLLQSQTGPFR